MSLDFDQFPLDDDLIKKDTSKMSAVWRDFLANFYMNLISYIGQNGFLIPRLTTAQRDAIQNPQEGQMIYTINTTVGPPRTADLQIWQVKADVGAWRTITTTP